MITALNAYTLLIEDAVSNVALLVDIIDLESISEGDYQWDKLQGGLDTISLLKAMVQYFPSVVIDQSWTPDTERQFVFMNLLMMFWFSPNYKFSVDDLIGNLKQIEGVR